MRLMQSSRSATSITFDGDIARWRGGPFSGSSARPDVEAVGSSGQPHYVDVGLAATISAATFEQQKEHAIRDLLPPNTTFSAIVFGAPGPSAAVWLKKLRVWLAAAVATHLHFLHGGKGVSPVNPQKRRKTRCEMILKRSLMCFFFLEHCTLPPSY